METRTASIGRRVSTHYNTTLFYMKCTKRFTHLAISFFNHKHHPMFSLSPHALPHLIHQRLL